MEFGVCSWYSSYPANFIMRSSIQVLLHLSRIDYLKKFISFVPLLQGFSLPFLQRKEKMNELMKERKKARNKEIRLFMCPTNR
jgi:hypothetical protein